MKHIVVLDTGKEWGGGINSLLELLKRSNRQAYRFTVLLYRDLPRGGDSSLKQDLAALGIETLLVPQTPRSAAVRLRRHLLKAISCWNRKLRHRLLFEAEQRFRIEPDARRIAGIVRQLRGDLLYLNNQPSSNLEGYLAARLAGVAVVQHCRKVTRLNPVEIATANRHLDRMICVSTGLRDDYLRQGIEARHCRVVPNGIDLQTAPGSASGAIRARYGIPTEELLIGTVASCLGVKRLQDLLEAFALLLRSRPSGCRCLIVGDGPLRPLLERRAAELGIADRVIFAGFQSDPLSFVADMDIFALTSEREGMPRVILEAMLLGKPVVASRVTGVTDLVLEGETGLLFPMGDAGGCAASLGRLGSDPDLRARFGSRGAERVRQLFSIESYVQGVERVFDEVLAAQSLKQEATVGETA